MSTKKRELQAAHVSHAVRRSGPAEKPVAVVPEVSAEERSRSIRVRAYGLWERAGKPDGDATRDQFWCEAEAEIMAHHGK